MAELVQITPNFPPSVCGVGDHAAQIAAAFDGLGVRVYTIVASENPISEAGRSLQNVRSSRALAEALHASGARAVIVHFSGYGYAPYGLCDWLVDGLRQWKDRRSDGRIVTLFHEVYATGPIWRKSFWTSHPQRRIGRDLARLTDRCFVSSAVGAAQLGKIGAPEPCEVLPVFSNVGEPAQVAALSDRPAQAAVFGGRGQRELVYEALARHAPQTDKLLTELNIDRLLDVGPEMPAPSRIANRPVEALGVLSAEQVSETLAACRLGLFDYPASRLTKSGILAAYLAHGVLAFNTRGASLGDTGDGGAPVMGFASVGAIAGSASARAGAGHDWYRTHNVATVARRLFEAAGVGSMSVAPTQTPPERDDPRTLTKAGRAGQNNAQG